jgi:hypothetical protein
MFVHRFLNVSSLNIKGPSSRDYLNAGTEVSLRLSSLDYLGLVASRLRRDAVQSKLKLETIDTIINSVKVRSSVADPVPFRPLDPGWVKSKDPDPRSGMKNRD